MEEANDLDRNQPPKGGTMNRSALTALISDLSDKVTNVGITYANAWRHRVTSTIDRSIKFAHVFGGHDIIKISHLTLGIGRDYEANVNRRLIAEGKEPNFVSGSLVGVQWLTGYEGLLLINNSGEEQLRTYADSGIVSNNNRSEYIWDDGRQVTDAEWRILDQFRNAEHGEGEQGGVEKKVMPRNLFLSKILEAKAFGKVYR